MPPTLLFLIQALLVVAAPYALWRLPPVRHWMPLVAVQILFGVACGPSLLGDFAPGLAATLFPAASLRALDGLAWLAVTFFAFLVGLHFDLTELEGRGRCFTVAALGSVVLPTALGALAGAWLFEALPAAAPPGASPLVFAAGLGVAAGVTALPVLGAILREMELTRHPAGVLALGLAAVNDAALWLLVAGLLAVKGGGGAWGLAGVLAATVVFGLALWFGARPVLRRLFERVQHGGALAERDIVLVAALVLAAAITTELIGIHYVVGAFTLGAVMPKATARQVLARFEPVVTLVLLPFFFIVTGLRTDFSLTGDELTIFLVMTAVSVAGKVVGTAVPIAYGGGRPGEALVAAAFMQCKGLMELVVLTILRDAGIISAATFSALVLMALATTAATKPLALLALRRAGTP